MNGSEIDHYYGLDIHTGKGYAAISCDCYMERTMAKLKLKARSWSTPMDSVKVLPKLEKPLNAKPFGRCTGHSLVAVSTQQYAADQTPQLR
jgi:hypothetical protein